MSAFRLILAEKDNYPVAMMCRVLGVSRSGFYAWCVRPMSAHDKEDEHLVKEITAIHMASRETYGNRRVRCALRKRDFCISLKRVARLRAKEGIVVKRKRHYKTTTKSIAAHPVADNLLTRSFDSPRPNAAWVTDVTYVWTLEGWIYLAAIIDLCSRRVVGWSTSASNDAALAIDALRRAVTARRPASGWLHHSDRGSVYTSEEYRKEVARWGGIASMSRKGNCWDNAVAESFFATIKGECLDLQRIYTRTQGVAHVRDYIDSFYNVRRLHSTLGYESPIEFELKLFSSRQAA